MKITCIQNAQLSVLEWVYIDTGGVAVATVCVCVCALRDTLCSLNSEHISSTWRSTADCGRLAMPWTCRAQSSSMTHISPFRGLPAATPPPQPLAALAALCTVSCMGKAAVGGCLGERTGCVWVCRCKETGLAASSSRSSMACWVGWRTAVLCVTESGLWVS